MEIIYNSTTENENTMMRSPREILEYREHTPDSKRLKKMMKFLDDLFFGFVESDAWTNEDAEERSTFIHDYMMTKNYLQSRREQTLIAEREESLYN